MSTFVDTSALLAALDADDPHHEEAIHAFDHLVGSDDLVTHNYVHVEAEQLIRRRLGSKAAVALIDRFLPTLRTMWVDEPVHAAALAALREEGRTASLVDQVSFMLMRREGITDALAYDADFDTAGFHRPRVPGRSPGHRLSEELAPYSADSPDSAEPDLVGVAEIAARSGHPANTVQSWRRRHHSFPAAAANLATGPVWQWPVVAAWIDRRGASR